MPIELVTVRTKDGVELDGAFHARGAEISGRRVGVLMVHGLTWNFYRGPSRWLPPLLASAGFSTLSLNMRDHDLTEPKEFELAHHDLRAGIDFLEEAGSDEVVLLGHGFACNKIACYAALSGDQRSRRRILTTLGAVKAYRPEIWDMVLRSAPALRGDTLVVQGAVDKLIEARPRADELVAAATGAHIDVTLLDGADHYFDQRHVELAGSIVDWLRRSR